MTKGDKAKELFLEGYTCCQAVVAAFADEPWFVDSGLTLETACKLASSFGGGMGRLREVCGAVSGMFMISGLAQGFAEKKTPEKATHYQRIQDLAAAFKKENGSIICRELLGLDKANQTTVSGDAFASTPEERTPEYYKKRPCPDICKQAANIIEQFLEKQALDFTT